MHSSLPITWLSDPLEILLSEMLAQHVKLPHPHFRSLQTPGHHQQGIKLKDRLSSLLTSKL
jgi:hypothetical protein